MKSETILTKDGQPMKTKEGKTMQNHIFEVGDVFIPQSESIIERKHDAIVKDKKTVIIENKIVALVKDKTGTECVGANGETELFITLTPTQSETLKKNKENGVKLTENIFVCYKYTNSYGDNVGIGLKSEQIKPKKWEDFEKTSEE